MTRPKGSRNRNPRLNFGVPSNGDAPTVDELPPDQLPPEAVTVEIENHEAGPKTFRERLTDKLSSITQEDNLSENVSESTKWRRKQKGKSSEAEIEFASLVSSLFVVIVAVWRAPEEVKPNDNEIDGVSNRVSKIILRHVDISGRMTADVLDLIGIIAIGASWYARVAPAIRAYSSTSGKPQQSAKTITPQSGNGERDDEWITPIQQADPGLKNWLDRAASGEE